MSVWWSLVTVNTRTVLKPRENWLNIDSARIQAFRENLVRESYTMCEPLFSNICPPFEKLSFVSSSRCQMLSGISLARSGIVFVTPSQVRYCDSLAWNWLIAYTMCEPLFSKMVQRLEKKTLVSCSTTQTLSGISMPASRKHSIPKFQRSINQQFNSFHKSGF